MRVVLSYLNFGPYHVRRLEACREAGLQVHGLAMAREQSEYGWQTIDDPSLHYAFRDQPLEAIPASAWVRPLERILTELKPDVCAVAGYSHPAMLTLANLCLRHQIPWVMMSDSQEIDEPRRGWQEWIKSRIVRLASSGFAAGSPHVDYLERLGMERDKCCVGYDVVDNDYFANEAVNWRRQMNGNERLDKSLPITPRLLNFNYLPYFLASNRFIEKKNLFRLLDAYARYSQSDLVAGGSGHSEDAQHATDKDQQRALPWDLCMLGDGELREKLLAHCETLGLYVATEAPWEGPASNRQLPKVYFPGFRQIDELPRFYAHAGVFVHASTSEQWGLVVNEAMASSLPVIVSNRVGCVKDLIEEGCNGFTFDPYSVEQLTGLLFKVSALGFPLASLGSESSRRIKDWGLNRFTSGLKNSARKAMENGAGKSRMIDHFLMHQLIRR